MICMKNLIFPRRPRAKVMRQGPPGSARAQPWILFKPSLNVDILEITEDKNGRFLVTSININQDNLCLVNIYAPNDQNQQVNFFDKIIDPICRSSTTTFYHLTF